MAVTSGQEKWKPEDHSRHAHKHLNYTDTPRQGGKCALNYNHVQGGGRPHSFNRHAVTSTNNIL